MRPLPALQWIATTLSSSFASQALGVGGLPALYELRLSRNLIGDDGLLAIAQALSARSSAGTQAKAITNIELQGNPIPRSKPGCCGGSPDGLKALRAAAKACKTQVHLG